MTRNRHPVKISNDPLVSVLVPTYNRKWLLPRTLQSILTQSYKNIEIVLVNDAGEDVQDAVDKFNDPRIKYFQNDKNKGLAGTRNVALSLSKGDYISLLDDDDIYLPYTLEFRLYMMKKLNGDVVYSRALQDIWEGTEQGYVSKHKQLYWDSPFDRDLILIQNVAPCCCPLFSRKAWDNSGNYWFDETMTTSEDHDFWCGLSRKTDFHELKLVDCECSYRTDKTQMTGALNFVPNWIKIFKRWRHTAINLERVAQSQNDILKKVGINPEEYEL
jgi:glycosyltransferase involved in cell wall biosynthesis